MAFGLYYNDLFPLRLINFIKKYLELGGVVQIGNRIAGQLSKLQLLDSFFPSLFIRELSPEREEAEYDFSECYILAPRKYGVLSNWGPYKQKINEIEDCLLGNSRSEKTYKNYTAAHSMLRRAASDLLGNEASFRALTSNLRRLFNSLGEVRMDQYSAWMKDILNQCQNEDTMAFMTASRTDGFSFEQGLYELILEYLIRLDEADNRQECFVWMCVCSLFGNYSGRLLNKYSAGSSSSVSADSDPEAPRLISSPSVIAKPGFCGRSGELRKIDELFEAGNRVVFLSGIGGIGKTEIAKQYAAVSKSRYDVIVYSVYDRSLQDLIVSDIPFETVPSIPRLITARAQETDEAYFKRKLSLIRKKADENTLIILDNFNTDKDENLYDFLSGRYRVLITTQYDYSKEFADIKVREISDMDALLDIFMYHYQGYSVERDDPDLISLFKAVNCHTYTIVLLAHHMENSGQTAAEMLEALEDQGITSLNEQVPVREGDQDIAWQNLARMFSLSEFSEEEKKILQLLALVSTGGIPAMEFMKWAELPSAKNILALERRGWIMRQDGGINLHPVVRRIVQHYLQVNSQEVSSFLNHFADYISEKNSWHFTKQEKERACMICRNIMGSFSEINKDTEWFYQCAAALYGYSGYPERSIALAEKIYEYICDTRGQYSFETAKAAYRPGWVYLFYPQMPEAYAKALEWLLKACEIFENIPRDTVDKQAIYCGVMENISKAYSARYELTERKHDLSEALRYAEKAVSFARRELTDYLVTKRSPAGSLLRLSDVKMTLMEYEEAESLISEAYEILTAMFGPSDPDVLRASSRKAIVLYHLGRYEEALKETDQNLEMYRKFYGTDNPSLLDQLIVKIRCCRKLGYTETAAKTEKEALEAGKKIYSPDSKKMQALKAEIADEF
ncbi:MAG: tetratricopeptide repeat protein [Solobacterium sp.]|nr:tetratricopeptide repeat protein [Solobacterium sp.]